MVDTDRRGGGAYYYIYQHNVKQTGEQNIKNCEEKAFY